MALTIEQLAKFAPRPKDARRAKLWDHYAEVLLETGDALALEFGIDEVEEWWGLIANVAHESGGLTIWQESGNYSSADRIMEIFGVGRHSAGVTAPEAAALVGNGPELFERVYGLGNPRKAAELGNTDPGDGWNCRGLGPLQTTGGADHLRMFGRKDGNVSMEDGWRAAFQEWDEKKGPDLCRAGQFAKACRAVNGGANGLADRQELHAKAKKIWPVLPFDHSEKIETKPLAKSETMQAAALTAGGGGLAAYEVVTMKVNEVAADASASLLWKVWVFVGNPGVIGAIVTLFGVAWAVWHRLQKGDLAGMISPKQ
jgi:predicted chitinase